MGHFFWDYSLKAEDLCSTFHPDNVSYPRADFSRFYNDRESDRETITVVFLDK
jgi:hypothetical protein